MNQSIKSIPTVPPEAGCRFVMRNGQVTDIRRPPPPLTAWDHMGRHDLYCEYDLIAKLHEPPPLPPGLPPLPPGFAYWGVGPLWWQSTRKSRDIVSPMSSNIRWGDSIGFHAVHYAVRVGSEAALRNGIPGRLPDAAPVAHDDAGNLDREPEAESAASLRTELERVRRELKRAKSEVHRKWSRITNIEEQLAAWKDLSAGWKSLSERQADAIIVLMERQ